jgi:cold shock CspA family protein
MNPRGFGFISRKNGKRDIFFHITDIHADATEVMIDQPVYFREKQTVRGPQAVEVMPIDENNIA